MVVQFFIDTLKQLDGKRAKYEREKTSVKDSFRRKSGGTFVISRNCFDAD